MRLPFALWEKSAWPRPKTTKGYRPQQTRARTSVTRTALRSSARNDFIISLKVTPWAAGLDQLQGGDNKIDELNPHERDHHSTETINEQVPLQNRKRADRFVNHATQRQRDQSNDDQRVENNGAENGAGRAVKMHDV